MAPPRGVPRRAETRAQNEKDLKELLVPYAKIADATRKQTNRPARTYKISAQHRSQEFISLGLINPTLTHPQNITRERERENECASLEM